MHAEQERGSRERHRHFEEIEVSVEEGVATPTLNHPERYNALGARVVGELGSALDEVEVSGTARAMILTGAGEQAFCSGVDLKERAGMDTDENWAHNRTLNAFVSGWPGSRCRPSPPSKASLSAAVWR